MLLINWAKLAAAASGGIGGMHIIAMSSRFKMEWGRVG
jgi:hypothetical protein